MRNQKNNYGNIQYREIMWKQGIYKLEKLEKNNINAQFPVAFKQIHSKKL